MIYQVRINLYFEDEPYAIGLYNHCKGIFSHATSINPDADNAEFSILELINNNHDQHPAKACELVESATNQPEH